MTSPRTHLVIGDGASAAAFATSTPLSQGDRLVIIGPDVTQLGRGLAYRDHPEDAPWRYAFLLNSPNQTFQSDFLTWFTDHWSEIQPVMARYQPSWLSFGADHIAAGDFGALFAPRALYGDWIEHTVAAGLAEHTSNGVRVERMSANAKSLTRTASGFDLLLNTGDVLSANSIDIATGGAATKGFSATVTPNAFPALYGFEAEIAAAVKPGQVVTCIGGNAAMLDVLRLLQTVLKEEDIRLRIIRRGGAPEPLILDRPRREVVWPVNLGPFDSADALLASLDAEIATYRAEGATMAQLRPGFSLLIEEMGLDAILPNKAEQQRAQHKLEGRFRRGTHDSLADYERLKTAGQIEEIIGAVQAIEPAEDGHVSIRFNTNGVDHRIQSPLVINTSGPRDPLALDPFTQSLIAQGLLHTNGSKTGLIVGPGLEGAVPGLRYLSPVVLEIGSEVIPFPLYDMMKLQNRIYAANRAMR
jgi:uncharacterized NAD(P)/FAD-binding protein YdhS